MVARTIIGIALAATLVPVAAHAALDPITILSDTQTEWFKADTNAWLPAVITTLQSSLWPQIEGAQWIWNYPIATNDQKENGDVVQFRRKFALPTALDGTGSFLITADNEVTAFLNSQELLTTVCDFNNSSACIQTVPITGQAGENLFEFTVTQYGRPGSSSNIERNLAGFVYKATFETPAAPEPVVVIPGMLASLNVRTIFSDRSGGTWQFTPGARPTYQALIDRFAEHGFTLGENLFIAHYDWRNPVPDAAANYLKPVIDEAKQKTGSDKVDIVSHSMGGLVSRSYIQGDSYENDVDQLITLGTPHLGASDAYVAWEGGDLPNRWGTGVRAYIRIVENALRIRRAAPLPRPLSFRAFFPSLRDILPVEDYVTRDGNLLAVGNHAEQNPFLQTLKDTANVLEQRGVEVTTIAGDDLPTLDTMPIQTAHTPEDVAKQRWRDGHPNPDPPATDTTLGDQTVLLSSALFGTNSLTLNNAKHDKLPEEAQEEVLAALGLDATGPHIAHYAPDSLMGTVVLSPITPSITLPDGTTFVCDATKQVGNVECVVDEEDPSGPKLFVILDPSVGNYKITLTGTASGEYHAITCFADEDQDGCTTREGTTEPGKVETYQVQVGEDDFTAPPEDILTLAEQLRQALARLYQDKHLTSKAFASLLTPAATMAGHAKAYQQLAVKLGFDHPATIRQFDWLKRQFTKFTSALDYHIQKGNLDDTAILELTGLRDQFEEAGI